MNSKTTRIIFLTILSLLAFFFAGYMFGQYGKYNLLPSIWEKDQSNINELFAPYMEAWAIVHNKYIQPDLDDQLLMHESIRGMVKGLRDAQSSYMDPDEYRRYNTPLQGEYTGIGAWVDTSGDYLTIISTIPGSPAEQVGLQNGDMIIAVNNEDVTGKHPELVYKDLLGPEGSQVTLTIYREGDLDPITFELTRALISIPSVSSTLLEKNIAYIQINQFSQDTDIEFRSVYKELIKNQPVGLILDLRGNVGGLLDAAIEITSEFIPSGTILIQESGGGIRKEYKANGGGLAYDIPLVILVDGGSASASEIVAGAIQDFQRGTLVGTTTYGKGSVQSWIPLQGDNGAVRITIALWLTPNGRQINNLGLKPDVIIENLPDNSNFQNDAQLKKGIEVISQQAKVQN